MEVHHHPHVHINIIYRKILIWLLSISLLAVGCRQNTSNSTSTKDSLIAAHDTSLQQQDTNRVIKNRPGLKVAQTWTDSLIENYINNSNNALIKLSLKSKVSEEWLFDQTINTDSAKFLVFQIGHDESDKGEKNKRFVTDQWIYIDSVTKRLYEYDAANDSLIRLSK
ncbi:hypothetical protein [Ferruginibacter sp. SUN106]|uniref:hypothetical protein n=1 Tax=Ferruginibacter sp. SUN106 TaxID=2978348 RepID=UPI003D35BFEA